MTNIVDTLREAEAAPGQNIDHLINYIALIARATRNEYGLSDQQKAALTKRVFKVLDAIGKDRYRILHDRIVDQAQAKNLFWREPSDTVLATLRDAGILEQEMGV